MTQTSPDQPALNVRFMPLEHGRDLPLPKYETPGSAGMDLMAAVEQPLQLAPGARALVPCGFAMALPEGWEAQVRPRSGLAVRQGLTVLNAPGTVDSDYRGEICVPLINLGQDSISIERGMRIAQMVIAPVLQIAWQMAGSLDETQRGGGGFGSTGL